MAKIREMFTTFTYVTTIVVFASAVYISIFWPGAELGVEILWQILGTCFLCSLGVLLIKDQKNLSAGKDWLYRVGYYIYVNMIVLIAGFKFEWFYLDQIPMVAGMVITIACVFLIVNFLMYYKNKKLADKILEKLKERSLS